MGFFHNEEKAVRKAAGPSRARLADIPVTAMAEMGCRVCPQDAKDAKAAPEGHEAPDVYVLLPGPDARNGFDLKRQGTAESEVLSRALRGKVGRKVRLGGVVQCPVGSVAVPVVESTCCSKRVIRDIEEAAPLVILGVGDAPLAWATKLDAYAPRFRGTPIAVKIGRHACWYYPVMYPNWALKENKRYGKSEHEVILDLDMNRLIDLVLDGEFNDPPEIYEPGPRLEEGVEIITGQQPGDMQRLEKLLADLSSEDRGGLDLETNGLRPWIKNPRIWMAAVGTFEKTVAFALDHPEGWGSDAQRRRVWQMFGEYILSSGIKECHNLGFEMEWLSFFYGQRILYATEWDDTMSMAHTLDERAGTKSLGVQTRIYYGFDLKAYSNIDTARIVEYPLKRTLMYNGMDAKWTNKLSRTLRARIYALSADPKLAYQHERKVRLAPALVCMEARGLPVDYDHACLIEMKMELERNAIEKRIAADRSVIEYTKKYGTFSPTNSDHVLKILTSILKRDEVFVEDVRLKTVRASTDADVLSSIPKDEAPIAHLVLEHRGVEKLLSTYIRPLTEKRIISADGRIHSKYSSMVAVTGRLAGEDPNPQNWPKRKHREVRGVVAAEWHAEMERLRRWLLACDYGQIEFRVVGMASEDENLVKYCWTGYDVHKYWAERVVAVYGAVKDWVVSEFGVDWDEAGIKTLRQEAKNKWVFPQLFGSSTASCARNLHLPDDIAEKLGAEFWDEFPSVKRWQKRTLQSWERLGYVETLGGNKRRGAMSPNEIINMPIQGTAAEIVCEAMCALTERAVAEEDHNLQNILNVHDDLTFEVDDTYLEPTIEVVVEEMCKHRFDYINVPLVVEVSVGHRWSDLEEIGKYRSDELFNLRNPFK